MGGCAYSMSDDDDHVFEKTEGGASAFHPMQAGELRKGSMVMIRGRPCKCAEVTHSKAGKHGHAKVHVVGVDVFAGKKYEDMFPAGHNVLVPFMKRTDYEVQKADASTGEVRVLLEDGTTTDMRLPLRKGTPSPSQLQIIRQDFNRFDTDSSDYIQSAELGQLLAVQLGRQPTEYEQRAALEEHDCNRDKQLSFKEYVDWLYKIPEEQQPSPEQIKRDTNLQEHLLKKLQEQDHLKMPPVIVTVLRAVGEQKVVSCRTDKDSFTSEWH